MNPEGQKMALSVVKSLSITPPKKKPLIENTFNNSGEINNDFMAYGRRNSVNQNVTMQKR